ncbi:hypothetical protein L1049_024933 [Liquidambar formosana]|uniref:Uncharacterized protein n=1 Tax=Liquidambar formosana TaxID=63359 RepID=A0AAP0RWV0_LIQFO
MGSIIESKFTYCFGNHSNPNIESHLVLGNGVFLEGQTTPPKIINGRYHLTLEGISVGEKRLAISSDFQLQSIRWWRSDHRYRNVVDLFSTGYVLQAGRGIGGAAWVGNGYIARPTLWEML